MTSLNTYLFLGGLQGEFEYIFVSGWVYRGRGGGGGGKANAKNQNLAFSQHLKLQLALT